VSWWSPLPPRPPFQDPPPSLPLTKHSSPSVPPYFPTDPGHGHSVEHFGGVAVRERTQSTEIIEIKSHL